MNLLNNLSLHESLTLSSTTPLLTDASGMALAEHTFFGADFGCCHVDVEKFLVVLRVEWKIMAIEFCGVTKTQAHRGPLRVQFQYK
jgi:hypothetical protein